MSFTPHTESDIREMLATIGVASIDELFDEIPRELVSEVPHTFPSAMSEMEVGRLMSERAAEDGRLLGFIGGGAYEHHVPAAVWSIATRGEFYSAYTPYQAEASQGTLQVIYEFQTMIAAITGMEVANASLYDGASALAEAVLMTLRLGKLSGSTGILMPRSVHPAYRRCVATIAGAPDREFIEVGYTPGQGTLDIEALEGNLKPGLAALVVQQPNYFGLLEDVDAITNWAHRNHLRVIAVVNPVSLALLKPPGDWGDAGADIVVGEGQPLGIPLSGGGPYLGFMATRMEHVRQMPGRIVGRSVDVNGRPAYTLTLQAREQHIRRGRANSNICTNQGLLATAATIYLALMGAEGLERVAATCMERTSQLVDALSGLPGVKPLFSGARFHEAVLTLNQPVGPVLSRLAEDGIGGGVDLGVDYPELGNALLVCATETKTINDIDRFGRALGSALSMSGNS